LGEPGFLFLGWGWDENPRGYGGTNGPPVVLLSGYPGAESLEELCSGRRSIARSNTHPRNAVFLGFFITSFD